MKITFLITGLGCGGAEHQVVALADSLSKSGHKISIISLTGYSYVKPSSPDIPVIELKMRKTLFGFLIALFKCRKIINQLGPDVVHSHMVHANIFARLLRLFCKLPKLICTAHSMNEGGKIRMLLYRATDGLCELSTNVSQAAVDRFISLRAAPRGRIIAVNNGVDIDKFRFLESSRRSIREEHKINGPLLLAVGRLTEAKDYPNLLRATAIVKNSIPNLRLWIVGEGTLRPQLCELVTSLNLTNIVQFLGVRKDIPNLMSAADVLALSSAWEGFPLVVGEAMACECHVVATDVGGVRDIIGETGLLAPKNSSTELASAILATLDKVRISERNPNARNFIREHFSLATVRSQWESIYLTVTSKG